MTECFYIYLITYMDNEDVFRGGGVLLANAAYNLIRRV